MKILNVNFTFNTITYGQKPSLSNVKLSDELSNLKELQKRGHTVATVATDRAYYITEQKRLKNLPPQSMEHQAVIDYLEWITDLPWGVTTYEPVDLNKLLDFYLVSLN